MSMTIYQQIVSIVDYLLVEQKLEQCPDEKHVTIQLIWDKNARVGTVQIDSSMQEFHVRKFKANVWNNFNGTIKVHHGNRSVGYRDLYTVTKTVTNTGIDVHIEKGPYVEDCEHYLCFVLKARKRELHELHARLKAYVHVIAAQHQDVLILYTVSECLQLLEEKHEE